MKNFDIVIIGAGPAGGQCARVLTKKGYKVLLVEQHPNFLQHDFSSAGTPLETLNKFDLPTDVVGSFWQKITIVTTNISHTWSSQEQLGAVLNFAKLREFLASEVEKHGGEVWFGYRYINHQILDGETLVELRKVGGEKITVSTKILVDASGPARAVISKCLSPNIASNSPDQTTDQPPAKSDKFFVASGIEYLIEVPANIYEKCANNLIFFLGYKWMPKGYSWIFPMENNRLKVGAAKCHLPHLHIAKTEAIKWYIELIIKEYLELTKEQYTIVDIHGANVKYCSGLRDIYYHQNIIGIGDVVSSINMLGGEGIRHGMDNAMIASKYIDQYLQGKLNNFRPYEREIKRRYAVKWNISEQMGRRRYLQDNDQYIDKSVNFLKSFSTEDMINILFYYKFDKLYRGLAKYLQKKLSLWWQSCRNYLRI